MIQVITTEARLKGEHCTSKPWAAPLTFVRLSSTRTLPIRLTAEVNIDPTSTVTQGLMSGGAINWGQTTHLLARFPYAAITNILVVNPTPYLSSSVPCDSTATGTNCNNVMTISEDSEFIKNCAGVPPMDSTGGAIYSVNVQNPWRHDLYISNTKFMNNQAYRGAVVKARGSTPNILSIKDCEITSNGWDVGSNPLAQGYGLFSKEGTILYDMDSPNPGCPEKCDNGPIWSGTTPLATMFGIPTPLTSCGPTCTAGALGAGSFFGFGYAWTKFEFKSSTCTVNFPCPCRPNHPCLDRGILPTTELVFSWWVYTLQTLRIARSQAIGSALPVHHLLSSDCLGVQANYGAAISMNNKQPLYIKYDASTYASGDATQNTIKNCHFDQNYAYTSGGAVKLLANALVIPACVNCAIDSLRCQCAGGDDRQQLYQ